MNKFVHSLLPLFLVGAFAAAAMAQEKIDFEARGRAFITAMFSDHDADAVAMMNDQMKSLGTTALQRVRSQITQQSGTFKSITSVRVEPGPQNYTFAIVICEFEKSSIGLRVVFEPNGKVAGLNPVPSRN